MPKITYVEHSGEEHVIDADPGLSVMECAIKNMVPGIEGDCGGSCACATCHVVLDKEWFAKLGKPDEMEDSMLDLVSERSAYSRLCCQIEVSEDLEGLVLHMPEEQG